jgi:hypothetical protein
MASAATTAFGTYDFSNFGTGNVTFTNTPSGNVLGANTTQIVLPGQIITGLPQNYLGQPNSFCNATDCGGINGPDLNGRLAVGQSLLFEGGTNTINISGGLASLIDFLFSNGTNLPDRYEFLATGLGKVTPFSSGPFSGLIISYTGTFTDSQGFFFNQTAQVGFTFTQAAAGATVGESASFSTPSAVAPEPVSMALIGGGVVVIGLVARKKRLGLVLF